ncbi:hypothetical protein [Dactylosporangium sp. NPDC050588]|uniref:hypothetical protein n=1 Tax=Dactylosporangium sp. NPDC050588 TaxID=3157211 RepID=UPI0033CD636B
MPIPSRWRLLDHDTDAVLAGCDDIDGLFTDRVFPVRPVYERYTLLGCTPEGPLRAAVDGTGPAWLGAEVARAHLVPGYDRKAWTEARTFDDLISWLTDDGVEVELR